MSSPPPSPADPAPQDLDGPGKDPRQLAPKGAPFDPMRTHSRVRTVLAFSSFLLFAVVVLVLLIPVAVGWVGWADVEQAATVLLPAVTAVTGSVTTFYFATNGGERGRS